MFQFRWLWENLRGRRLVFVCGLLISVVTSLMQLVNPKLTQVLVDEVVVGVKAANGTVAHHTAILLPLLIAMGGVTLARTLLRYFMVLCMENSSQHMVIRMRDRLFKSLMKQDMKFYDAFRTGDLMTRLTGDLDMVRHAVAWISYNITDSVVLYVSVFVYFLTVSWQLTLALFATTPVIFGITYLFSKRIRPVFVGLREKLSQLNTVAQENIAGNRVVKAFSREAFEMEKFGKRNDEFRHSNLATSYTWLKFYPFIETIAQSLTVITILAGGLLIMGGKLTFGQLTAVSALTWAVSNPMRMLGMILNDLQRFFASANKVIELYYAHPTIVDRDDAKTLGPNAKGAVRFEDVSFGYGGHTVLEHVNLDILPGETVGIMGPTGSGKTTLVNLIARFYDATGGRVLFDGVDVRELTLKSLRSRIGMATQDVFLFSDTIDSNIAYGRPDLPDGVMRRAAEAADADAFIRAAQDGYDTIIGERGVGLSGGQRQRLALARALAVHPPLLVLDDTTSAVDMETEEQIRRNLAALDYPCTKIIIAQRYTSVRHADRIIILKGKGIAESGTHEELMRRRGYYYGIVKLQQEGFADTDTAAEKEVSLDGAE